MRGLLSGTDVVIDLIRGQERRQVVFSQNGINVMDVVDPIAEGNHECRVTPVPSVERGKPVEDQGFLRFIGTEPRCQADAQDGVPLQGVFLAGDQLVTGFVVQIGGDKDILLCNAFFPELHPHVICERTGSEICIMIREKLRQFSRGELQNSSIQGFADIFIRHERSTPYR